ncbi:hypothetical protein PV325_007074 [Microctonus aethiopoides]|nr:hypothetical protein PV325_007074 [Microctonus aethiopoides]
MRHESLYLLRDRGNRSSVPTVGATGAGRNTPSGTQGRAAVRNLGEGGSTCLDSPARKSDLHKAVGLYPCHRQGGNQRGQPTTGLHKMFAVISVLHELPPLEHYEGVY